MVRFVLAALPALVGVSALAGNGHVSASAVLTDIAMSVDDLRPGDGVPPTVVFDSWGQHSRSSLYLNNTRTFDEVAAWRGDSALSHSAGGLTAALSTSASTLASAATLDYATGDEATSLYAPASTWAEYVYISPYTSLTLSALVDLTAFSDGVDRFARSSAWGLVSVWNENSDFGDEDGFEEVFWTYLRGGEAGNLSDSVVLGGTFLNDSADTLVLRVSLQAGVSVAALPEPQTYALMLVGLAALAGAARRRKG